MSHPLGCLHSHAPSLTAYRVGQTAMHDAFALVNQGEFAAAAEHFQAAARTAKMLAAHSHDQATTFEDHERAWHWATVAVVRLGFAREAVAAADDEMKLMPLLADYTGRQGSTSDTPLHDTHGCGVQRIVRY